MGAHEHCRFCVIDGIGEEDACCICVRWRKRKDEVLTTLVTNLVPHTQYGCHDHSILKNANLLDANKYIEAINGARRMRSNEYKTFGCNEYYNSNLVLKHMWQNAHAN